MAAQTISIGSLAVQPATGARNGASHVREPLSPPCRLAEAPACGSPEESASVEFAWPDARQLRLASFFLSTAAWMVSGALPHWLSREQIGVALIAGGTIAIVAAAVVPTANLFTRSWNALGRYAMACAATLAVSAALAAMLQAVSL